MADVDLISFTKSHTSGRYYRGIRHQHSYLLLTTVLGMLSDCMCSQDLEAFTKSHRKALNKALGRNIERWSPDPASL